MWTFVCLLYHSSLRLLWGNRLLIEQISRFLVSYIFSSFWLLSYFLAVTFFLGSFVKVRTAATKSVWLSAFKQWFQIIPHSFLQGTQFFEHKMRSNRRFLFFVFFVPSFPSNDELWDFFFWFVGFIKIFLVSSRVIIITIEFLSIFSTVEIKTKTKVSKLNKSLVLSITMAWIKCLWTWKPVEFFCFSLRISLRCSFFSWLGTFVGWFLVCL